MPRREIVISGGKFPHSDPRRSKVNQGMALLAESQVLVVTMGYNFFSKKNRPKRQLRYLLSAQDGKVLAIIDSVVLSQYRTSAGGAVGAKYLSRRDSRTVGILGAGRQAVNQLRFLQLVRDINTIFVWSRTYSRARNFCQENKGVLQANLVPVHAIEEMSRRVDILVTLTPSYSPIVSAEFMTPGLHVNIIGADDPPKIELDGEALKKADRIVIAGEESFLAGQLAKPIAEGKISRNDIFGTLGEIVAGLKPGRERDDEITVFHSPGMTLQDVSSGYKAYLRVKAAGLGKEVQDPFLL
ncbi:MAG: ornithine cyclodeaminase family protein [Thaumarchaeota archaeon]|nr:ornithine cyclodeaminase family protein [Nitrososphaerota archaeon]